MAYWRLEIDLKSVFVPWRDEDFNPARLGENQGPIADALLQSDWIYITEDPVMFREIIDGIREAESMDVFRELWNDMYDLADDERVWIDT